MSRGSGRLQQSGGKREDEKSNGQGNGIFPLSPSPLSFSTGLEPGS